MPGHFSKWVFGAGSWNRTLLRPLHPLTWYGSTCRNSAPLSGKRASMNNRLLTSFPVFSLFCSGYLSREGFCFVLPTCDFLLPCWGSLLRSTVSCEGHIHGPTLCKFSLNFQTTEIRSRRNYRQCSRNNAENLRFIGKLSFRRFHNGYFGIYNYKCICRKNGCTCLLSARPSSD